MRRELLRLGMSQLSAGSKTDVGAYHRCAGRLLAAPLLVAALLLAAGGWALQRRRPAAPRAAPVRPRHLARPLTCAPRPPCRSPPPSPYRSDDSKPTEDNLGDLQGQFSLADHRPGEGGGGGAGPSSGGGAAPGAVHRLCSNGRAWRSAGTAAPAAATVAAGAAAAAPPPPAPAAPAAGGSVDSAVLHTLPTLCLPLPPPVNEIVVDLMKEGYVPSWCTACYRKGAPPAPPRRAGCRAGAARRGAGALLRRRRAGGCPRLSDPTAPAARRSPTPPSLQAAPASTS